MAKIADFNMASTFSGLATFSAGVKMASTLTVTGATKLVGALNTNSTIKGASTLTITGNETLGGNLAVAGTGKIGSTLTVTGATKLVGALNAAAIKGASTLTLTGNAQFGGTIKGASTLTLTGNADFNGTLQVASTLTATGGITGNLTGGIKETGAGGVILKCKVVEIGAWDMDALATLSTAHGLADFMKIRSLRVVIRRDNDDGIYPLDFHDTSGTNVAGSYFANSTNISMARTASGLFDSINFDTPGVGTNRGWIMIWYEA